MITSNNILNEEILYSKNDEIIEIKIEKEKKRKSITERNIIKNKYQYEKFYF